MSSCVVPVLVVSPSPTLRELFDVALTTEGYTVYSSDDDNLDPERTLSVDPALVVYAPADPLRDLVNDILPLRAHPGTSSLPVLVCSSQIADRCGERLRQLGCEELAYPFDLDALYRTTERLIH